MNYTMKSGALYSGEKGLARIKGVFTGPEKEIVAPDGKLLARTEIRSLESPAGKTADVRFKEYIMLDADGNEAVIAKADYAQEDDPAVVGWPLCRMPRVDHAVVRLKEKEYRLVMRNSQNYSLEENKPVLQIFHRGLFGGWSIETAEDFSAELICCIFIFCRYIEQENEFLVV